MNQNENEKSMKEIAEDVQSIAKQAGHEAKETVKDFAHAAADATNEAVEDVKDAAHSASTQAKETLNNAKREWNDEQPAGSPLIDDLAAKAQDLAERSINFWADNSHRARRKIQDASEATNQYVTEQPGKSILIAAATGAAVAAAFILGSQKSRKK